MPPAGSVEYWSERVMFAPASKRKRETAATMPGRSGQETSSRIVPRASAGWGGTSDAGCMSIVVMPRGRDGDSAEPVEEVVQQSVRAGHPARERERVSPAKQSHQCGSQHRDGVTGRVVLGVEPP